MIGALLEQYNVSEQLALAGLGGAYEAAVGDADVGRVATLLLATSTSSEVAPHWLPSLLSRVVVTSATASELRKALREGDVGRSIAAMLGVTGELHTPGTAP